MRWVLRLIATGDDARCLSSRQEGLRDLANVGLNALRATLPRSARERGT